MQPSFLISFVNQVFTPELKIGLFDVSENFRWVLGGIAEYSNGITGLLYFQEKIYCCIQNIGIGVLDTKFNLLQVYESDNIIDPHSLTVFDNQIYVVSTGKNSIYKLILNKNYKIISTQLFWKTSGVSDDYDYVHLNSLSFSNKGKFVTIFGKRKRGQNWKEIKSGKIINIETNEIVLNNLDNPHSLFLLNDELVVCESGTGNLLSQEGKILCHLNGYVRGIAHSSENIIIAISARRKLSKSRVGILGGRVNEFANQENQKSYLYFLNPDSLTVTKKIDFSMYGNEIYEILPISNFALEIDSINLEKNPIQKRIHSFEENFISLLKKSEELIDKKNKSLTEQEKVLKEKVISIKANKEEISFLDRQLKDFILKHNDLMEINAILKQEIIDIKKSYSWKIGNKITRLLKPLLSLKRLIPFKNFYS